jgi:hypothetical protein
MAMDALARELKRGSTELLILSLLEERGRHGYDIARLIDERSQGAISFHVASLYTGSKTRGSSRGGGSRRPGSADAAITGSPPPAGRCSRVSAVSGRRSSRGSTASPASGARETGRLTAGR